MNREESLWEAARALWMKYCGVADEYRMLRDRWLYASEDSSFGALPYLRSTDRKNPSTFDLLDQHIENIDKLFSIKFKFDRNNMESFNKDTFKNAEISDIKIIEEYFYDLSNYVGLLKLGFFQRTVSFEIPHVASGIPHSPERTIGNELFYLAADTVAKRYEECLNIPYGKWDGFITFAPPITDEYFYGAFYRASPYLELFHISMSEEQKYFVGSYMAIAHEFGHSLLTRIWKIDDENFRIDRPSWVKLFFDNCYRKTFIEDAILHSNICKKCRIYNKLSDYYNIRKIFLEILSDIIAYRLNGKNYLHNLIDVIHGDLNEIYFLFRILVVHNYIFINEKEKIKDLTKRIETFVDNEIKNRMKICGNTEYECLINISAIWANIIDYLDKNFNNFILRNFEDRIGHLIDDYNPFTPKIEFKEIYEKIDDIFIAIITSSDKEYASLIDLINNKKPILSFFVVDEFKISKKQENNITNALISGEPCIEEDPRHILHCYYEAYKRSKGGERPNYPATIYSLAFNKFKNNRGE